MIKLKDFLQVAKDTVVIEEKGAHAVVIDPLYFKADLLSQKLLDSKIRAVGSMNGKLHIVMEGDIKES